jgi:hypothetical protein
MTHFDGLQLILEDGFSKEESVAVTIGSRSMINFVERRLAALKFQSVFTKLNIGVSKSSASNSLIRYREPKRFIGIQIQMDPGGFLNPVSKFHQSCAEMVRMGLRAASRHVELPINEAFRAIVDFIAGGYVNRWIHADKTWKRIGYRSAITCDLRTDAFILTQSFYRGEELVTEAMIARTKPREGLFYPLLGKLTLSESQITYRANKELLSRYDLTTGELEILDDNIDAPFHVQNTKAEPCAAADCSEPSSLDSVDHIDAAPNSR